MQKEQKSGFGIIGIIIITAAVAVLGGGYWYWQSRTEVSIPPSSDQSPVVDEGDFTGWKTYRNEKYGFEVRYPNDWFIEDYEEGVIAPRFFDQNKNPVISSGPLLLPRTIPLFEEAINHNLGVGFIGVSSTKIVTREHLNNLERHLYTESDIQLSDGSIVREIRADFLRKVSDTHYDTISFSLKNNDHRDVFKKVVSTFKFIK